MSASEWLLIDVFREYRDLATVNGAGIDSIYGIYADCLRAREGIRFKRKFINYLPETAKN
ncbi:unnamed protein product [Oppiella nova]|uniref:Uncharacterized protein n=1 Tax=Oppiella nova TaxID=334625 RepID=A0A7R9M3A2_9ACAR|nr:unnamed protein product [Oppiella nova]CAG2168824.1 unnamed protein product [Oppiella nova]